MEQAIQLTAGAAQAEEATAVKALATTAQTELELMEKTKKHHMEATIAMVDFVREHRGHINSFNALVDEALGKPEWMLALMEPGICNLLRTYCHD